MGKFGRLTIGIISRNGQPFIEDCLSSFSSGLVQLLSNFDSIEFILVDSDSTDNTLKVMLEFSATVQHGSNNVKTEVYLIEGHCNAAIARNVILNNCTNELLFLCDGDIVINGEFLVAAADKIVSGEADAVIGDLSEKWYDSEYNFYKSIPARRRITKEKYMRIAGSVMLLAKRVVTSGLRYDENIRIKEDNDFSLRVSDSFTILAIPLISGTHITQPYFSGERFKAFIKGNYHKPLGVLIRKNILSMDKLFQIVKTNKGVMVGFVYMVIFPFTLLLYFKHIYTPLLLISFVFLVDLFRQLKKRKIRTFFMYRFISPVMVIQGFFSSPKSDKHKYSVRLVKK